MKMHVVNPRVSYPRDRFKQGAVLAWDKFFKIADERVDIAHWYISPDSGGVRLSARVSSIDEASPDAVELDRVYVRVGGMFEIFKRIFHSKFKSKAKPKSKAQADAEFEAEYNEAHRACREWVEEGILEALKSARIQNKLERFLAGKSGKKEFAVVTADMDWGLRNDELTMLWRSNKKLTIDVIKDRQKPRKKYRARKLTPKELKAKGLWKGK